MTTSSYTPIRMNIRSEDLDSTEKNGATTESSKSTVMEATVNLTKLCIGSGILALPFAVEKGGLILSPIFLALIAWWNFVSCEQMMACKQYVKIHSIVIPSDIASTYSRIAYCGCGKWGVHVTDACIIITLLGVCVTFLITFSSLLLSLPFMPLDAVGLAILSSCVLFPVCCSKDVSRLVSVSFLGLLSLFVGILVIAIFGVQLYGDDAYYKQRVLPLWSENASDFATFIGIATFGYGTCSLAFPVEESMKTPSQFSIAAKWSLAFVWFVYAIVGDSLALLFVHAPMGISSNILRNLPVHAFSAHIVKLSMCLVCLLTFPLTFIPSVQMLEELFDRGIRQEPGQIQGQVQSIEESGSEEECRHITANARDGVEIEMDHIGNSTTDNDAISSVASASASSSASSNMGAIPLTNDHEGYEGEDEEHLYSLNKISNHNEEGHSEERKNDRGGFFSFSTIFRGCLLIAIQAVSINVPCFGLVVSLLGCFTVSILSYVLPPLFSLRIISCHRTDCWPYFRDVLLLLLGSLITIATTVIVAKQCITDIFTDTC